MAISYHKYDLRAKSVGFKPTTEFMSCDIFRKYWHQSLAHDFALKSPKRNDQITISFFILPFKEQQNILTFLYWDDPRYSNLIGYLIVGHPNKDFKDKYLQYKRTKTI